ncbi:MAG: Uma2 family endonuclease [Cyanobacteria bacterium P01_D01_bin.44]
MSILQIQSADSPLAVDVPAMNQMSDGEFVEFCLANRELRIERTADGEIIVMPPAFSDTGNRNFNLAVELGKWTEIDGTGVGFDSSAGFTLPNGAKRSPDAAWIKLERWQALTPEQQASFAPICPDFVIELRLASDTLVSLQNKMQEYIDNGAGLGRLIDRKKRTVNIYQSDRSIEVLENPDIVLGDPVLPGFKLKLDKIW